MNVWLVQRSEPTPHDDGGTQRAMRIGILAKMLVQAGHDVVWWTSTFDHFNRRHRQRTNIRLSVEPGYDIQYLRGCGYQKHVSFSRIRDNLLVARQFSKVAKQSPEIPDVILASIPTAELALAAVEYGRMHNIPVILDIRDLWPDVFLDLVPKAFRPAVRVAAIPMEWSLKRACKEATAIVGLTSAFVDWGLSHASRVRKDNDRVFPMGYLADCISEVRLQKAKQFWREMGLDRPTKGHNVVFFGTMGMTNDLRPIIKAAGLLKDRHVPLKFILCGDGQTARELRAQALSLGNVVFPGWVTAAQIRGLMELADIGIAPYIESINYINNIPNKPAEYLSGGLGIALSLSKGPLYELLVQQGCGFTYSNQPELLALELESLVRNPARLRALKQNALRTFKEFFDGNLVYTRMVRYLKEMACTGIMKHNNPGT